MACALIAGRASLAELTDGFVRRPDVQALMKRVVVKAVELPEDPTLPGYPIYDEVAIEIEGATQPLSKRISQIRGGPGLPLKREDLWAKFEGCVQVGTARVSAKTLFDSLISLERMPNVRSLPGFGAR